MELIPNNNILIAGRHCPAGEKTTAPDAIARDLIAQRLARPVPAESAKIPEIETAEAVPAAETAARRPARRGGNTIGPGKNDCNP